MTLGRGDIRAVVTLEHNDQKGRGDIRAVVTLRHHGDITALVTNVRGDIWAVVTLQLW